ncbi:MAG TPA: hypothetical protein VNI01_07450, partial [Elusimicrobiota bacterium]|nr:hypothetical protein [Elusimicrobiota bacterium]
NHSCRALGFAPEAARDAVSALGFQAFAYRPFARALEPLKAADCFDRNIVYVRDLGWIEARLRSAPRTCVHGVSF